jgi:hypothetical protein
VTHTAGWNLDARHELHVIWATSSNPAAARTAAETAEILLRIDRVANGDLMSEGLWPIVVSPIAVYYTIDSTRRHVQITDVIETT